MTPFIMIACERLPTAGQNLLASQPTITRLENHISKREVARMRSRLVEGFIQRYKVAPAKLVLDIDGWDAPTHGQQPLSCFYGYYGQHMYFPVLINEASSGYPLVLQLQGQCATHPTPQWQPLPRPSRGLPAPVECLAAVGLYPVTPPPAARHRPAPHRSQSSCSRFAPRRLPDTRQLATWLDGYHERRAWGYARCPGTSCDHTGQFDCCNRL